MEAHNLQPENFIYKIQLSITIRLLKGKWYFLGFFHYVFIGRKNIFDQNFLIILETKAMVFYRKK